MDIDFRNFNGLTPVRFQYVPNECDSRREIDYYSNYLYYIEQVRGLKTKFKGNEKFLEFLKIAERENQ